MLLLMKLMQKKLYLIAADNDLDAAEVAENLQSTENTNATLQKMLLIMNLILPKKIK